MTARLAAAMTLMGITAMNAELPRNHWYANSVVNLHIDNHSGLVGKGHTVDELVAMVRSSDVSMIQVSASGSSGQGTFPTPLVGDYVMVTGNAGPGGVYQMGPSPEGWVKLD